jgi:hypothetical protein
MHNQKNTESPFQYGKKVDMVEFVNRKADIEWISSNLRSGINTLLISPRRWGKSSLIEEVAIRMKKTDKNVRFCFIDFFSLRSEEEFYEAYANQIIKATSSKLDGWIKTTKKFFKTISPKLSIGLEAQSEFSLQFDWDEVQKHRNEILDLPEKIAQTENIRIVICADEFQNLKNFSEPLEFEKNLRAAWQNHKSVSYCLYGSKRHMMSDIFNKKNKPFYRFGEIFLLEKIEKKHWVSFIKKSFKKTGKEIDNSHASAIADAVKCHSYYVQQLSHYVWQLTITNVTSEIVKTAIERLLQTNYMFYEKEIDDLSNTQVNLLKAIIGGEKKLLSVKAMSKYRLGTPRNVSKNRTRLDHLDIIDVTKKGIELLDPVFEMWLKKFFF